MNFIDPRQLRTFATGYLWLFKEDLDDVDAVKKALTWETDTQIITYWHETDRHLLVPRFFNRPGLPAIEYEYRSKPKHLRRYQDNVTSFLDEEQENAWNALRDANNGILTIPGGRGKTVLAVKKICHEGLFTTITATLGLLEQWKGELMKWGGIPEEDIGWVQGKKIEFGKPILLISQDTIAGKSHAVFPEFRDMYGLNIVDECHHFASPGYSRIPSIFRGKRIGLTATVAASDQRAQYVINQFGPVFYHSRYHSLQAALVVKKVPFFNLIKAQTIDARGDFSFSLTWRYLGRDADRNNLLLEDIAFYVKQGRSVLILSNNKEHVKRLHHLLPGSGAIHGDVHKSKRPAELAKNVVVATSHIAAEGLNKPELDTIILSMPIGAEGRLQQSFWRTLRDVVAKASPLIIVYQDPHGPCEGLTYKVIKVAKEMGYAVKYSDAGGAVEGLYEVPAIGDPDKSSHGGGRRAREISDFWSSSR